MKKVMQFRYYGDKQPNNQPSNITKAKLSSGSLFLEYYPIVMLDIQAPAGTAFTLNNSKDSVVIGSSGKFTIDLQGFENITSVKFNAKSLDAIGPEGLIINFFYEKNS